MPSAPSNRLTLIAVVGKAHDSANGALQQVDLLRRIVLPAARSTLTTIEAGYGQGRFTLLEILDAYRTVADAELMEHEALASFHTAVATIEGLDRQPGRTWRGRDDEAFSKFARRRHALRRRRRRRGLLHARSEVRHERARAVAAKGHGHDEKGHDITTKA